MLSARGWWLLLGIPVAALAVYGFLLLRRRHVQILPMGGIVLAVTVSAALVYGGQRFRTAAEPVLVVAAAVAVVHLVAAARRGVAISPTTERR